MKKLFTCFLLITIFQFAKAQNDGENTFKKFKVDLSLGYAVPQGSATKGGVIVVIEPKYAVMPELSVGIRMETAALASIDASGNSGNVRVLGSYLATGDYYFSNNKFRPFGGIGAGLYNSASATFSQGTSTVYIPATSQFGVMARAGFEYGHLRLGVEYNFLKQKAGYLGLKLGVCIGGGRKD